MNKWLDLLPSAAQTGMYVALGFLFSIIYNRELILGWLGGDSLAEVGGVGFLEEGQSYYLDPVFNVPILGNIVVWLFWGGFGCAIYCLFWGLSNTVKEAKKYEDAAAVTKGFWESSIGNISLLISSFFVFISLSMLIFSYALPVSGQLINNMLYNSISIDALVSILSLSILSIFTCHGFLMTYRTFNYARKEVFFE